MPESLVTMIEELMRAARDNYGVNPVIFLVIYLSSAPLFYYSLFRTFRALGKKLGKEVMLWSAVFLCSNVAPFVYVLFFGRNIPWWVYGIIAALVGQGILAFVLKLRRGTPGGERISGN